MSSDRDKGGDAAEGELGAVVLRGERGTGIGLLPLRPLFIALLLLIALDLVLRLLLSPDPRVLRDPQHPFGCYSEDTLDRLTESRRKGTRGVDVVLLGDSVLASANNREGERVQDYLLPELRSRLQGVPGAEGILVWNVGRAGSHAADLYAAFQQLLPVLGPGRDALVVLNSNIIFFSRRQANPPMLYPCLGPYLSEAFAAEPELRALLKVPAGPGAMERRLTAWVTRRFYLYQQRRRIGEALLHGPPRDALRDGVLDLLARLHLRKGGEEDVSDPNLPWFKRSLSAAQFQPSYDFIPLSGTDAVNYRMTLHLAALLAAHGEIRSFVFLTPQNHGLLGALADNPTYHAYATAIGQTFIAPGVPFKSYDGRVSDRLFLDLDHLSAGGNQRLAQLIAEDIAPRVRSLLQAQAAR